jgi:hypothetical protein
MLASQQTRGLTRRQGSECDVSRSAASSTTVRTFLFFPNCTAQSGMNDADDEDIRYSTQEKSFFLLFIRN